jgi:hypothetical protein
MAFIMLRTIPSFPSFIRAFIKRMLTFFKSQFCIGCEDNEVFVSASVNIAVLHLMIYIC